MLIIGYILAILIGVSLGLIGGGGSILTVPILVYAFGISPELSTAYSLFIVGLTALAGSWSYFRNDLISIKTAIIFSIPSLIAVFLTRKYMMPAIPQEIFSLYSYTLTKPVLIMSVFAALMIATSFSMIRKGKTLLKEKSANPKFNFPLIFIEGIVIGVLTGFVGAGGGFLIIPALVLFAKLPIKLAVGTSLLIIAIKSLLGFTGDLGAGTAIDWQFLMIISGFTIAGIFAGSKLSSFISAEKLKPMFGWFVLAMGIFILLKETILKF